MRRRASFNPKRRIRTRCDQSELDALAGQVWYGGNPEHKRNPGDFGLPPPSHPRSDKTLCDAVGIVRRSQAEELLRKGVKAGLISEETRGGFPQNIWSVTDSGEPLEAQLENRATGTYHGYPLSITDPFRHQVLQQWHQQSDLGTP